MKEKVLLSWSGGKDSAMALYEIQKARNYDIAALLTTITDDYDRISIHGVHNYGHDMRDILTPAAFFPISGFSQSSLKAIN